MASPRRRDAVRKAEISCSSVTRVGLLVAPLVRQTSCPAVQSAQSQSRRLKMTYRLVHTTAIRTMAKGYPSVQCNSGMCVKFMP